MFPTSFVAAVSGLLAVTTTSGTWQTDYRAALALSAEQDRPVVVFISEGPDGASKLLADGKLNGTTEAALRDSYVALYIDTATESGAKTSAAFGMDKGLVISDKAGRHQALRHEGSVSQSQLDNYLKQYAEGTKPVTTATNSRNTSTLVGGYPTCAGGNCSIGRVVGQTQPVSGTVSQPAARPAGSYVPYNPIGYGMSYGTCANGRCGTVR